MRFCACVAALGLVAAAQESKWDILQTLLEQGVSQHIYPGATAAVFTADSVLWAGAAGAFTYGVPPPMTPSFVPPMTLNTSFDLASCTKVVATLGAAALLVQKGDIGLDDQVYKYLPEFASEGKEAITVRHLLLHNSGMPADPYVNYASSAFGCPETSAASPQLSYSCRGKCFHSLMGIALQNEVGAEYVYSDCSMLVLMNVIGQVVRTRRYVQSSDLRPGCDGDSDGWQQCYYEAFVRLRVLKPLGLAHTQFLPPRSAWANTAPSVNDASYRHRTVQGEVHDSNAFAMGGVAGHAGLFSDVLDLVAYTQAWLAPRAGFLNATTLAAFTAQYDHAQSSRALGWNTNADDAEDHGWNYSCGTLSSRTFMHTGYTGTMICADPTRTLGVVLLTNRVYPDDATTRFIHDFRNKFTSTVQKIFDAK